MNRLYVLIQLIKYSFKIGSQEQYNSKFKKCLKVRKNVIETMKMFITVILN